MSIPAGLPILANSFFEKHRPSLDVFLKWQSAANWSSHFMPLYHWDDVLFVGCSQGIRQKVNTDQKVVYVFCESEMLSQLWEEYQSPTVLMQAKHQPKISSIDLEIANEKTVVGKMLSDNQPAEQAQDRTVVSAPAPVEDMPEGISPSANMVPSATPQSASFDDLGLSSEEETPGEAAAAESPLAMEDSPLEGLDLSASPTVVLTPSLPATPVLEEKQIEEPAEEPIVEEEAPPVETKVTKTFTNITSITSTSASPEQVFQMVFKDMSHNFKKTMLLMKQGEQIVPWKWDDNFEKSNPEHKKTAMSLAIPSPFRIVYRSQKSYHGYIVPNDLNDKFFAEWNGSQNPDHLTLSPILIDDVVVGMILGIGDKSANNKTCLLQTEHMAEAVAKKIKAQPGIAKAA
jgi:hypothetical protein